MTSPGLVARFGGRFRGDGIETVAALAANGIARFLSGAVVGRVAGAAALGLFQSSLALSQLAALLFPTALGSAASKYIAYAKERDATLVPAVIGHLARRTVQTGVPIVVVSSALWLHFQDASVLDALPFALLVLGTCAYAFVRGVLYGSGQVTRSVVWDIVTSVGSVVVVAAIVLADVDGSWILLAVVANYLTYSLANWPYRSWGRMRDPLAGEMDRFAVFVVLGTLASTGFLQLSMVLAQATGGNGGAGQYGAAFVISTPAALVGAALGLVWFPRMAAAVGRSDLGALARETDLAFRRLSAALIPLFVLVIAARGLVVDVVWGPSFHRADELLTPLLLAVLITTLAIPSVTSITSRSQRGVRISAYASGAGLLTGVVAWAVSVDRWGVDGIAWGYLLGTLVTTGTAVTVAWRWNDQAWGSLVSRVAGSVLLVAVIVLAQDREVIGEVAATGALLVLALAWMALWPRDLRPPRAG